MICIESLLLGTGLGCVCSFLVWHYLLTGVVRNRDQLKTLIGKLISEAYHKNIFPEICRLQGILQVMDLELQSILQHVDVSRRPDHYLYGRMAFRELRLLRVRWLRRALREIKVLKERFDAIIKKYEPYQ